MTTTTEQLSKDVNDSQGLARRVQALPDQVRGAFESLLSRVRSRLDIPRRSEVSELLDRIDALDRKLADLEKARLSQATASVKIKAKPTRATKPKTAPITARSKASASKRSKGSKAPKASKASRRKAIENAAKKRKPRG